MLYLLQIYGVAPRALGPQGRSILGEISQIYPNPTKSLLNQYIFDRFVLICRISVRRTLQITEFIFI